MRLLGDMPGWNKVPKSSSISRNIWKKKFPGKGYGLVWDEKGLGYIWFVYLLPFSKEFARGGSKDFLDAIREVEEVFELIEPGEGE